MTTILEPIVVRVKLEPDLATQFNQLKKYFGINASTDMLRFLIRDKYRAFEVKKLETSPTKQVLTKADEDLLVVAAEDFWERYHHFEEGKVRNFLTTRYLDWPSWKIDLAVDFVCSQSRKN